MDLCFLRWFYNKFYDIIKQIFIRDVKYIMNELTDILTKENNDKNHDDNLYVNNIIVKKNDIIKSSKKVPYIATEKWIMQLGERLVA